MSRVLNNRRGMTLIEFIITLALLVIVIALVYSLYFFSANSYAIGNKQSNMQFDTRMAADKITRDVRYASSVDSA